MGNINYGAIYRELERIATEYITDPIEYVFTKAFDGLKSYVISSSNLIKDSLEESILSAYSSTQTFFEKKFKTIEKGFIDDIIGPVNEGLKYTKQLPNFIKNEFGSMLNEIKKIDDRFVSFGNSIKQDLQSQVQNIKDDMINIGDTVTDSFKDIGGGLEDTFVNLGNTLYNGVEGIGNQLEDTFVGVFESMISTFITLGDDLTNVFGTVFDGIIKIGLWFWECIQYMINCFTCVAYYAQKIFTSSCIIFYIFRLIMLIIWGFFLAFLYMINKPDWAGIIMNGIYKINDFFLDITEPFYDGGIDIIGFFYPEHCYDCGFSFSDFPPPPSF
jgi:hypothetical protein